MVKINEKALASTIRHFKGNAVVGAIVALAITTVKTFVAEGFKIGFNLPTLFVLGVALAVAVVTVGTGLLLKKRPDLKPELELVDSKVLAELKTLANQQIAASGKQAASGASGLLNTLADTELKS